MKLRGLNNFTPLTFYPYSVVTNGHTHNKDIFHKATLMNFFVKQKASMIDLIAKKTQNEFCRYLSLILQVSICENTRNGDIF